MAIPNPYDSFYLDRTQLDSFRRYDHRVTAIHNDISNIRYLLNAVGVNLTEVDFATSDHYYSIAKLTFECRVDRLDSLVNLLNCKQNLEQLISSQRAEAAARAANPTLQAAYEKYQMLLKLTE